jgi:hypothetical protein
MDNLEDKSWFKDAENGVRDLLLESMVLVDKVPTWSEKFVDYSFVVFPAAKAYEGYLKKVFLDRNFITPNDYYGKHFRIGKALNPSLEEKYRSESVYDKVIQFCDGDRMLADLMWETWKNCRNMIFHFFPNEKNAISFEEAKARVGDIISTMEEVSMGCRIK